MARLVIHLGPVAEFREAAKAREVDPVRAALLAEIGGADGIACTLPDEAGPFSDRDIRIVREMIRTDFVLFVPALDSLASKAMGYSPNQVVLVPAKKPGATPGGGLDALGQAGPIEKLVRDFRAQEIRVSLLVEPMIPQIKAAARLGADGVMLHLGRLESLKKAADRDDLLENLSGVSLAAEKMGLSASVINGVTYQNIPSILSNVRIGEVCAGRTVFGRALWIGMEAAVRDLAALVH
ncbi:MAG TPA: hypothetical protein ENN17_10510 [bacterium]|nr:hypothetical protein [bacterium]